MWLSSALAHGPPEPAAAFWPWWWSAAALGGVALGFWLFERRTFGVSGSMAKVIGGAIATLTTTGHWEPRLFHDTHRDLFGGGIAAFAVLLGGGMLTGFGTRMAGGCTSGHGLIGCARMQPGSLVTTATFFGTAIAVSMALHYLVIG